MRKFLVAAFSAALLVSGVAYGATAASATTPKCVTVHDHITKTDTGHGSPAAWADLSLNRTTMICGNHILLVDKGTLWTKTGAGSPNGTGAPITHQVPGKVHGVYHLTFSDGTLVHHHGDVSLSSTEYVKSLFSEGTVVSGGDYAWLYTTCREKWLDSSANNDGVGSAAGNITGKVCFHRPPYHHPRPCVTPSATPLTAQGGDWKKHPAPKPCPTTPVPTPTPTTPGTDVPPGEAGPAVPVKTQPHFTG